MRIPPLDRWLPTRRKARRVAKRALDVAASGLGLVASAPLIALVALAIRVDSSGPIFFAQDRLGRKGLPLRIYKFRKFHHRSGCPGPAVTLENDARMTRVGRWLERTKLDELPQLWNILRGDMSLVGPRPETLKFSCCFEGKYERILAYKPGIFGPNQYFFRHESKLYPHDIDPEQYYRDVLFPLKARVDLTYFPHASTRRDLLWASKSVSAVLWPPPVPDDPEGWLAAVEIWTRTGDGRAPKTRFPSPTSPHDPDSRPPCGP
jgi:lipopolysaccharide/colanic/teichoic acid biosynthesis glycosyltransferase